MTDPYVTINQKYQRAYRTDNWSHMLACSNSMRALKVETGDRRWFYPEMTEVPWEGTKFTVFRQWLDTGGLAIIHGWAKAYGDYVKPYEHAPMTGAKANLIEESRSEAQREVIAVAEAQKEARRPIALLMSGIRAWAQQATQGKVFDSDQELRRAMITVDGISQWRERIRVTGRKEYVLINADLKKLLNEHEGQDNDPAQIIRQHVGSCADLMRSEGPL